MAALWNDSPGNSAPYGTRLLTIPYSGATTYIADTFTITRAANVIERTDNNNEPNAAVIIAGFTTGQATLQLASGTTPYVSQGMVFYGTNLDGANGVERFGITEVTQPEAKADFKTQQISFRKLVFS